MMLQFGRRALPSLLVQSSGRRTFSQDVYMGKPDKQSNIRPLVIMQNTSDTALQIRLNDLREKTQKWHHIFWAEHNANYSQSREKFVDQKCAEKSISNEDQDGAQRTLEPEDMAVFHRQFLHENSGTLNKYDRDQRVVITVGDADRHFDAGEISALRVEEVESTAFDADDSSQFSENVFENIPFPPAT